MAVAEFGFWSDASSPTLWDWLTTPAVLKSILFYVWLSTVFIAYFCSLHVGLHLVYMRLNSHYATLDTTKKRVEYRTYTISPIHHMTSIFISIITMFYACGNDKSVFNDLECMNTPLNMHVIAVMHTCSYFIVDTAIIIWWEKDLWAELEMLLHHCLSILNLYAGFAFMNFTINFGIVLLFTEISTIFICLRWFLYTHGYGHSTFAAINSIMVFFTFLIFRLGFQVFACFGYGFPMIIR